MINSDLTAPDPETGAPSDAAVAPILRTGALGAFVVAGIATAVVVAIWFAFYLFVFVPRAMTP